MNLLNGGDDNMYYAVIDSGTTNSRIYLLSEGNCICKKQSKVGVKDTVIHKTKKILRDSLTNLFYKALDEVGLREEEIAFVLAFGMITSEIGLMEVPHLWVPAGIGEMADNIVRIEDRSVFPVNVPIYFIRGLKNYYTEDTTYSDIRKIDFMRGEETQITGLLTRYRDLPLPLTAVVFSSHTKFININTQREITGSLTTMSGQIYEALKKETSIGKSIEGENGNEKEFFDEKVIETAYDAVENAGLLRALLMPRFMEVLLNTEWYKREMFVHAAIVAEDLKTLNDFHLLDFSAINFALIGHEKRCGIFNILLKNHFNVKGKIISFSDVDRIDMLGIEGAVALARRAGLTGGEKI